MDASDAWKPDEESISHPETLEAFADFVGGTMGLGYDAQTIEALWKRLKNPA